MHTYQRSSRLFLSHELLGSDVGLLKVDMAVLNPKRADITIAIEPLRKRQLEARARGGDISSLDRSLRTQGNEGPA